MHYIIYIYIYGGGRGSHPPRDDDKGGVNPPLGYRPTSTNQACFGVVDAALRTNPSVQRQNIAIVN